MRHPAHICHFRFHPQNNAHRHDVLCMCAQRSNGSLRGAVRRQSSSRASWLQVGAILDARQHLGSSRLDNAPAVVPKSLAKLLRGGGDRVAKAHGGVGVGVEGARGGGLREERRCCGALAQRRLCVATHPAHQQQGLVEGGSLRRRAQTRGLRDSTSKQFQC